MRFQYVIIINALGNSLSDIFLLGMDIIILKISFAYDLQRGPRSEFSIFVCCYTEVKFETVQLRKHFLVYLVGTTLSFIHKIFVVFVVEGLTTNILPTNEATLPTFTCTVQAPTTKILPTKCLNIADPRIFCPQKNYLLYSTSPYGKFVKCNSQQKNSITNKLIMQ